MSIEVATRIVINMAAAAGAAGVEKIRIAKAIRDELGLTDWATSFGYIKAVEAAGSAHSKDFVYSGPKPVFSPGGNRGGSGGYSPPPVDFEVLGRARTHVLAQLEQAPDNKMLKDTLTANLESRNAYNQAIQSLKEEGKIVFAGKDPITNGWTIALRRNRMQVASHDPVDPSQPEQRFPVESDLPF